MQIQAQSILWSASMSRMLDHGKKKGIGEAQKVTISQAHQQLVELQTVILLGESTLDQMGEYDWIEMENGQIVDLLDVEADTQRQVDALARMTFEQKLA